MPILEIEGLGRVEIEGDTPNEAEIQAINNALQKRQASVSTPSIAEEEDASFLNEVVPQLAGGIRDAAQSALNLIVNRPAEAAGISFINEEGNYDFDYTPMAERASRNTNRAFKPLEFPTVNPAKTTGGNVIRTMSQFFVPYLGAMKVIGVGKGVLSNLAKAEGAAILTEQLVFDPFDEKLADLVQDFPALSNPITEYLQTDDDDTERDARFKLALESAGLGAMFVTISSAIKGLTQLKKGNHNQALDEINKSEKANLDDVAGERSIIEIKAEQQGVSVPEFLGPSISRVGPKSQPSPLPLEKYVGRDIQSTKDLQDIISSVETKKKAELDYYNDKVHSKEHVRALSQESGLTPEQIRSKDFNAVWNDGEQYRMRELMAESAIGLHDLAVIAKNSGSEMDLLRLKDALDMHVALQGQVKAMRSETGRALRQWRYVVGANIDEMLGAAGGKGNMNDIAEILSTIDPKNVANVNQIANKLNDPTLSDKFMEVWINGLLSGPQTHAVNMLSNVLTGLWSIPENYLAAGIGALKRTPDRVTFGEANVRAFGYLQGAKEGISLAKKTFLTETPSDIFSKLEARREKAIEGRLGKLVRLPGRALMTSDEFFKAIGYRMELNAQGYRSAIKAGLKPNDRKFAEHMKGVMDDLPVGKNKEETEELIKAKAKTLNMSVFELEELKREVNLKAINNARYLTFTKPLEGMSRHISKITSESPMTKLIAPFIRTPVNIVRFAAERTPFGMFMREHKGLKGAAKDTQQAKLAFGAMVGASTVAMAAQGKITGSGPSDPNAMRMLRLTGWQPYSFVIEQEDGTKRYLAYNRIEPLGIILGLSADFSDIAGSLNDEDADSMGARISASISKNLTDKTFFRGITDVIEAANDPNRFFDSYTRNMVGTIVPTGLAQATRTIDPLVRDTQGYGDKLKSRIPGYSQTLEARPNFWGEPIIMSGGLGPDIVSPIYSSFSNNDLVSNELVRLKYSPSMPQRSIDGVRIPPDLYNRFVKRAGKLAYSILEEYVVSNPEYRKLDKLPSTQVTEIKKVIDKTRAAASVILRIEMGMVFREKDANVLRDIRKSDPEAFENLNIPEKYKKNL